MDTKHINNDNTTYSVEYVDNLQCLATKFIKYIAHDEDIDIDIRYVILKIITVIKPIPELISICDEEVNIDRIVKTLSIIKTISNCPVGIWESDTVSQTRIMSTLGDLLKKTLNNNYHTIVKDCQSYDTSKSICRYSNPLISGTQKHIFKCDFHLHDSVSMHLVLACIHNGLWALHKNLDDEILIKVMLFGLYHDIGKPLTVEAFEFKNSMVTGFPAHAEVGMMMFQSHHSPLMDEYISRDNYLKVGNAILRHMCGYHGDKNHSNKYKRALLMLEQKDVLELLIVNRIGDHFGKLADVRISNEPPEHFIAEQILFEEQMRSKKEREFDLPLILKSNINKQGSINPHKIVVYLIGTSGAGKTHLLNRIINTYLNNVSYISRDECIAEICVGLKTRFENKDYMMMYSIYEAGKKLSSLIKKNNANKKQNNNSESDLINAKKVLINAQKQWNEYIASDSVSTMAKNCSPIKLFDVSETPDIGEKVQKLYERRIRDALKDDKLFLIMDTFMNCFPMAVENAVPHEINKCFRVHIHVQSYLERTSSSVANSVSTQLKISGSYGLHNPLHPDGFKYGNDKKSFASLSSEIGTIGSLPKSTFKSKFRPHLVYVCTRTENGDYGYDEMFDSINDLVSKMLINKPITNDNTKSVKSIIDNQSIKKINNINKKIETNNINVNVNNTNHIFPLNIIVLDSIIVDRLINVGEQVMLLLDFNDPDNKILNQIRMMYTKEMIETQERINNGEFIKLPRDPLTEFEKRSFDVKCKIVINYKGLDFAEYLLSIYTNIFPELNTHDPSIKLIIFNFTMSLKPWSPGYLDRIKALSPTNSLVLNFINLM